MVKKPASIWNPTVIKLGLISFFADISSEMLYPITPIFLSTVLGTSMTSIGMIEGIAEAVASLLKGYSGVWSDRLGKRKIFIVLGYLLAAIAKPITGVANSWHLVLFARGLDRTGKGLRGPARDALLAETVLPSQRGAVFGWHRLMDTMGATLGPLFAIYYLAHHSGELRTIYFWALLPGLLAVILALAITDINNHPKANLAKTSIKGEWKNLSPAFKNYLAAWLLFSLGNSSDVFLLLRAKQAGLSITYVIFLYCFYNLFYALASPSLGKLSDLIARKNILIFGLAIFAAVYLGFSQAYAVWHFWVLFACYGIYMAATDGIGKALAIDLSDPQLKASSLGVMGTLTGIATIFASTIAGELWDHFGAQATFIYGAAGAIVAAIILLKVKSPAVHGRV